MFTFIETTAFTELIGEYFESDDAYRELQWFLAENPEAGAVIPGCGGLRKLRWAHPRRGKGKRGGLRVIYLLIPAAESIAILDVYDKDESIDLDPETKRMLSLLADQIRRNLVDRSKR